MIIEVYKVVLIILPWMSKLVSFMRWQFAAQWFSCCSSCAGKVIYRVLIHLLYVSAAHGCCRAAQRSSSSGSDLFIWSGWSSLKLDALIWSGSGNWISYNVTNIILKYFSNLTLNSREPTYQFLIVSKKNSKTYWGICITI